MKWCIIVNGAPFVTEFLGKLAFRLLKQGDECVLVYTSKMAEYTSTKYFPREARVVSKVDWCRDHYNSLTKNSGQLAWRELSPDFDRVGRWPWGYEASTRFVGQEYQFFEKFFLAERPDAVLFEPPSGLTAEIAFRFCERQGIPYLGIIDSRISGRLDVFNTEYTNNKYPQTFSELSTQGISQEEREFADRFLQDFLSHKRLPAYYGLGKIRFTPFGYIRHYITRLCQVGSPLWRYARTRNKFKKVDFESEVRLRVALRAPFEVALRQLRIARQKHFYQPAGQQEEYYFFPLHFQPEASTSVQARYYTDQASTIRNIAFALPFPCVLYVKEHPAAIGRKRNSFYREIKNLPNVRLIGPQENIQELILHSQGVVTLTSTVGLEAVLAGKLAYVLGNVFYEYHPLCRSPKNIDELREQISADRNRGVSNESAQEVNTRFLVAYLRNTISGSVAAAVTVQDVNQYQEIARELKRIVQA